MSTADRQEDERRLLQPHDGGDLLFGRFGDGPRDLAEAILDETAINVLKTIVLMQRTADWARGLTCRRRSKHTFASMPGGP